MFYIPNCFDSRLSFLLSTVVVTLILVFSMCHF